MTSAPASTPLSVLDRSPVREGHDGPAALRDTVRFAQQAEALGYHRFWVSEHHSVPGVAGSAPTVLAAAVASATSAIRVGTGGVMLPNHQPFVVAEQFAVLASLFPGRIDMGLGRSVGFTEPVRRALGRGKDDMELFERSLDELLRYFADPSGPADPSGSADPDTPASSSSPADPSTPASSSSPADPGSPADSSRSAVRAHPADALRVPAYILATGEGAGVAARAGLPLVIGGVRGRDRLLAAIDRYRAEFTPTPWGDRPYVIYSGTVAVAETDALAHRMLLSEAWSLAYSRTHGVFPPLLPPERIEALTMTERERRLLESGLRGGIAGTEDRVREELTSVIKDTGADEVLVTTAAYDRDALLDSYRRLARIAGTPEHPLPAGDRPND
ncbi:LLM class flavin-dependent oxidoreductase [Streptomyces jumonjinensis]|uniref:LLM class flavin-dependent oxidoreductase n=1 Tax=Streptomyces jumonjinensis TaxID=1945 RepID=UPI0037A70F42